MNINIQAGPNENELLFLGNEHRSWHLFNNGQGLDNVLNVRRGDLRLWQYLEKKRLYIGIRKLLHEAGLSGIIQCGYRTVDHGLITALVERWRPETHSFHLTVGEATVTLQDVSIIWGLPVEGEPLSGVDSVFTKPQHIERCQDLLGFTPQESDIRGGKIKIVALFKELERKDFPDVPNEVQCLQRARLIIFILCGATLFPDSSNNTVSLLFLNNLINLSDCGKISWGSAVLASLYRNLCKATHPGAQEIGGPMLLLQIWAWERFTNLAPLPDPSYNFKKPLGARWRENLSFIYTTSHSLRAFRSQLQSLREGQFKWMPYSECWKDIPTKYKSGHESWLSKCCLIAWEIVEPYSPDRVMRQFGMLQYIPGPVPLSIDEYHTLHNVNRGGKSGYDWLNYHTKYVTSWNNRQQNRELGEHVDPPYAVDGYMTWYFQKTILFITNPALEDTPGFQNDGASYQLMLEGLSQVHRTTREPVIQGTVSQVMGLGHQHNRLAMPIHLTTQPTGRQGNVGDEQPPRRRDRRRIGRRARRVPEIATEQNDEDYEFSNFQFQNTQEGAPSNTHQQQSNMVEEEQCYTPTWDSPSASYTDFGVPLEQQTEITPTDNMIPPISQDLSEFNLFAYNSHRHQPHSSNISPLPLDLSLGMNPGGNDSFFTDFDV